MCAKSSKSKGQKPSSHPPISLVVPITQLPDSIPGWQKAVKEIIEQWQASLQVLVYGIQLEDNDLKEDESLKLLLEKGDVRYRTGFQSIGEAMQAASKEAQHPHIVTWTGNNSLRPLTLRSLYAKLSHGFPDRTIVTAHREIPDKNARKALQSQEGKGTTWFRGLTSLRHQDPGTPLKCYPTELAAYIFQQLPPNQPYFEAAALHWASLEGIEVIPIGTKPNLQDLESQTAKPSASALGAAIRFKWHYQLKHPFHALRRGEYPKRPEYMRKAQNSLKLAFSLLLIALFIAMPLLSFDYGATGDENLQDNYGEKLVDYYLSLGQDQSALNYKNLYLYGGLFEFMASGSADLINPMIKGNYRYEIRHVLNSLVGFLAILFTALLGRYIGGWRGGLLALLMLALSPRFFGHCMNNPKDIPFAAFYIMGIYFLIKLLAEIPKPDKRTLGWLIVAIGAAISVRIGGLLLIAYLGLFLLVAVFRESSSERLSFFRSIVKPGLIAGIGGYLAGLIFWPYGHQNPFLNPFRALENMSDFPTVISVLFEGQVIQSSNVPWYYIPQFLVYTAPLFALIAFGLMVLLLTSWRPKKQVYWLWPIIFAAVFPVVYIIYKGSNLYDGMRQVLFIYPPFVLAGAMAVNQLFERFQKWGPRLIISGGLTVLMAIPFWFMITNHPNQVVYYNSIAGGVDGAYGEYELDYWGNSTKQAAHKLATRILGDGQPDSMIQVKANFAHGVRSVLLRQSDSIKVQYASFKERSRTDWDYAVFVLRFIPPKILENYWPPKGTIDQITVNGTPITTIIKRENYNALNGFRDLKNQNFKKAIQHFEAYRQYNPKNASVLSALARSYVRTRQLQKAQKAAKQALNISPGNFQALGVMGRVYQQNGQIDRAIRIYERAVKMNRGYAMGYYQLGRLYYQKQQPRKALRYLGALRQVRPGLYKRARPLVKRCRQMARQ